MKLMKTLFTSFVLCGALAAGSTFAEDKVVEQTTQAVVTTQTDSQVAAMMGDKLNINIATASEIQKSLTGIGAKKAEAIVQYREKHGNFTNVEQLLEVQGIGKATLEKNRDRIIF
ncbi:TPA: helix-hairpin-helix domain-containing protein [Haemophilus influenzae]|uniref:helix-hairpin-helix domain-containing protein n=1 Tax=Haemophilus influenzae TaxID=727 RepID=UPI001864F53F|nr:helix-hairpin-helix domain-containing protein [Haemophilus influenzae]